MLIDPKSAIRSFLFVAALGFGNLLSTGPAQALITASDLRLKSVPIEIEPDGLRSVPIEIEPDGLRSVPIEIEPDGLRSVPIEIEPDGHELH